MVAGTGGASSGPTDPKLVALRQAMAGADGGKGVDVYVVPTEDPHMVRDCLHNPGCSLCSAIDRSIAKTVLWMHARLSLPPSPSTRANARLFAEHHQP